MTPKKISQTRRAVLKEGALAAVAAAFPTSTLMGAQRETEPPYDLDGCKTYQEYKRRCRRLGMGLPAVSPDADDPALAREGRSCMNCGRCDRACMSQQVAHWYRKEDLKDPSTRICMYCGQCVSACIYNVLHEKLHFTTVASGLESRSMPYDMPGGSESEDPVYVAMLAPAVRVAYGEFFGEAPGSNLESKIVGALRKFGFDYVFDVTFGADLTTFEETREFRERLKTETRLPLFTSCCPAWVRFVETFYPEYIPNLSTTRSPILAQSAAVKTMFAKEKGIAPDSIVTVAFVPCVGKKYEATRKENAASAKYWGSGEYRDLDYAITTREFGSWSAYERVKPDELEESEFDSVLGTGSGSGRLFGASGGVLASVLREMYWEVEGRDPDASFLEFASVDGAPGRRETTAKIGDREIRAAIVSGLAPARALLEDLKSGKVAYDAVEVMACPGGCVGGGGQPKGREGAPPTDAQRAARAEGLKRADANAPIRVSGKNPELQAFYEKFIEPGGDELRESLLHTSYEKRDVWKS